MKNVHSYTWFYVKLIIQCLNNHFEQYLGHA